MTGISHQPKSGSKLTGAEWESGSEHTTTETDTTKVLSPDGAGGVQFVAATSSPAVSAAAKITAYSLFR